MTFYIRTHCYEGAHRYGPFDTMRQGSDALGSYIVGDDDFCIRSLGPSSEDHAIILPFTTPRFPVHHQGLRISNQPGTPGYKPASRPPLSALDKVLIQRGFLLELHDQFHQRRPKDSRFRIPELSDNAHDDDHQIFQKLPESVFVDPKRRNLDLESLANINKLLSLDNAGHLSWSDRTDQSWRAFYSKDHGKKLSLRILPSPIAGLAKTLSAVGVNVCGWSLNPNSGKLTLCFASPFDEILANWVTTHARRSADDPVEVVIYQYRLYYRDMKQLSVHFAKQLGGREAMTPTVYESVINLMFAPLATTSSSALL